jgi:hypothetical protein
MLLQKQEERLREIGIGIEKGIETELKGDLGTCI